MEPVLAVIASVGGPVFDLVGSLVYTQQEQDQYRLGQGAINLEQNKLALAEKQLLLQSSQLKTQAIITQKNNETLIIGIGLAGLLAIGALAVYKS